MKVKSNALDHPERVDTLMSKVSSNKMSNPPAGPKSYTPGLAQKTNKMTYQTRSSISEKDTHTMTLLRTSEVGLISKDEDYSRFWTGSHLGLSKKLLSLIETDCVDLDFKSLSTLQTKTTAGSWFSITHKSPLKRSLSRTLFPSSTYSPVEFTDSGSTLTRSRKIRIYPNKEDIRTFKKYLGLSRYWYNQAVEYLKQPGTKASLAEVRKIQKNPHPEWAFNSPQRIMEHAISDACAAVRNAKRKFKLTGEFQEVGFRSKKCPRQGFGFDKQSLQTSGLFRGSSGVAFYASEEVHKELEGSRITKDNDRWFLVLPRTVSVKKPENQRLGTVALDPGVRTFQTYFSPFAWGKAGQSDFTRVYRLCLRLDGIISKESKADYRGRRRLRRAKRRLIWKIKDLINDLHQKFARFLVKNFDTILLPTFETSDMVPKLYSKVARSMLTWAHYRFKQFLKSKAQEYSCNLVEVNEAYTSRTCSFCGRVQNIGSKSVFKCPCGAEVDRDINGARNIFLKNISLAMPATALSELISDL